MAHMSQDHKKKLAPKIQAICKEYGIKATLSVHNQSTLNLNMKSGVLDFGDNGVNEYYIAEHYADKPRVKEFLLKVKDAMLGPDYFDKSDVQSDYFFCSHYISINIGKWNKPYILTKEV
jgi:hypothetical protein